MTDRLRFVVVGGSGHASRVVAPSLKRASNAVLTGVVGSRAESASLFADTHSVRAFSCLEEALDDASVDALWIAAPNHLHAPIAISGARAGKHLLIEKPLASNLGDAQAIVGAVEEAKIVARVGYQHRFRAAHRRVRELLIREAAVGPIGLVRIHRFWKFPYFDDDRVVASLSSWRRSAELSGGWVTNDIGSHLVDLIPWLTGMPATGAAGLMATQKFDVSTEDTALMALKLGDRAIATLEISAALESPGSRIEVYGQSGWLRVEDSFGPVARIDSSNRPSEEHRVADWLDPYISEVESFAAAAMRGTEDIGTRLAEAAGTDSVIDVLRSVSRWIR